MDEELWKKTRNKKNLLKLLRKGDKELCKARIARTRELVAEEERLAEQERETRLFCLRQEGELVVARRAALSDAYAKAATERGFGETRLGALARSPVWNSAYIRSPCAPPSERSAM